MTPGANKSLLVIGECMMELSGSGETLRRCFAGDTYNVAVYAKRSQNDMDVQMLTAVGSDPISDAMMSQWAREGIGRDLVMVSAQAHPGLYAVTTDRHGERSFTYWRDHSAATELVSLLTPELRTRAASFDCVFFSGITLAILSDSDKACLLDLLSELKRSGALIAFDPNYRARLWADSDHASQWLTAAYRLTDIALPGLADQQEVFGHQSVADVQTYLEELGVREMVIKAEGEGVFAACLDGNGGPFNPTQYGDAARFHLSVQQHPNPRDTTGAGDSFAGTYLAARSAGFDIGEALEKAAAVARVVVQHPGAIVDLQALAGVTH